MSGLRWQLLGPTAALFALLWLVQAYRAHHEGTLQVRDEATLSVHRIHNALTLAADSVADPDDLFRVWTAMAAEREIGLLLLAEGDPAKVVIASRRRWIGRELDALAPELGAGKTLLLKTLERGGEHQRIVGNQFWFAAPFELNNDYLQLPQGTALLLAFDLQRLADRQHRAIRMEIVGQALIMLVALLLLWLLLDRRILGPLARLANLARGAPQPTAGMAAELVEVGKALEARMTRILEERARYDGVFEQAAEGIVLLHRDGRLERANPAARNLLNLGAGADRGDRLDLTADSVTGRDGVRRTLAYSRFDLRGLSEPLTVVMVRDITRQREAEALLRDAATHAERMARLQAEFVSTTSHELRTPLTSIRGTVDLLSRLMSDALPPTGRELIDIAQRNLRRLDTLINDLLDLGKLESGRLELQLVTTDLVDSLGNCVDTLRPYADRQGVRLDLEVPAEPALARLDPDRYAQIVANLVSNAIKYSTRGAGVTIRLRAHGSHWRTEVIDSGPGIPAAFRERIFSRFAQADASDRRAGSGTGLGLHISRSLAELMHGRLDFDSEPGHGSTFYVDLPTEPKE